MDEIRIDKWLWDVRLYKTRSQAADACHKGRVTIGDMTVKASRPIKVGEVVEVKKNPVVYRYKILESTCLSRYLLVSPLIFSDLCRLMANSTIR